MKRFYTKAGTLSGPDGWLVQLDGRPLRTPDRRPLTVPALGLAEAIAAEWNAQGDEFDPTGMLLTRLANVAIDRSPANRDGLADEFVRYCTTDLVCHLAEDPAELTALEEADWAPVRLWAADAIGIQLTTTAGIKPVEQPAGSLEAARRYAQQLDDFSLTGLVFGAGLFGSAVLAAALREGVRTAEETFRISDIDAAWQRARWGEDEEAMAAAASRLREARTLAVWFDALRPHPAGSPG